MQQSRYLTPRQAAKSKKPYATVPLCHCVTASRHINTSITATQWHSGTVA